MEIWALVMFFVLMILLIMGYPVAFTLGAVAMLFGSVALGLDFFSLLPLRIWGIMTNFTLLAVPLFIFMGVLLEKSGLARDLLESMAELFGKIRGGMAVSIVVVGALMAATTGVVGATVVTMGVIALPSMLKHGYKPELATGVIAASGTLGQIIPPSIVLILLGDVIGVPVGRLFMGAVTPGLLLVLLFICYVLYIGWKKPELAPCVERAAGTSATELYLKISKSLIPPLLLLIAVLGSIFFGIATPTESAAFGALGAMILAVLYGRLTLEKLRQAMQQTTRHTSMVFMILVGATAFGLVFRGMGGDKIVHDILTSLPGDMWGFLAVSMLLIFALGFFLDFIEICFVVVPILAPIAQFYNIDLLWFAVLIAVNLQTSFLTPPFGFSLFYLKAVVPDSIRIQQIYRGVIPFIIIQLVAITLLLIFPRITLWLPDLMDKIQGL